ncbi:MAG: alcohol dehydrogenase catalytic domain-containing protein [Thermoleophilaceae bacterium]|nr:alcohol dehydrogenase catalytic domain-containing protein [Thermoleophilaceae bacterium]
MAELNFVAPGRLEWRETDEPRLDSDRAALVRPVAVSTCDLDAAIVHGRAPLQGPFPIGHECVARVVETGGRVSAEPGSLVSVPFQISCGECGRCRIGQTGHCESVPRLSAYGMGDLGGAWGGFLSDSVRVPYADTMLVPLPDGVSPTAAASVSDNVVDAWRTVAAPLGEHPGGPILIVGGGGSIALYAIAIARALGCESVDYVDWDPDRLELARELGAGTIEGRFPERLGPYPITVDSSAEHAGLACAVRSTEPEGICTSTGIYFEPETPVPLLEAYTKGITFRTGRVHARPAIPKVLELMAGDRLAPEMVTAELIAWEDAAEALADHTTKLVVTRAD